MRTGRTTRFLGAKQEARRIGHIMGIGEEGARVKQHPMLNTFVAQTELNFHPISAGYMQEKLQQFTPPASHHSEFQLISEMFDHLKQDTDLLELKGVKNADDVARQQLARYQSGKPVHIPGGWKGHHIGITLFKGYIAVTNRGDEGDPHAGSKIYKLNNDPPTIEDLVFLQSNVYHSPTYREVQPRLNSLLGPEIASFPQQGQKKATCSYVNKQASVEPALCLLALDRANNLNPQAIAHYARNSENRKIYKAFTSSNRDSEVKRVITLIQQAAAEGNTEQLSVMVNLAYSIVEKQQRKTANTRKIQEEVTRSLALIQAIAPHVDSLSSAYKAEFHTLQKHVSTKAAILSYIRDAKEAYRRSGGIPPWLSLIESKILEESNSVRINLLLIRSKNNPDEKLRVPDSFIQEVRDIMKQNSTAQSHSSKAPNVTPREAQQSPAPSPSAAAPKGLEFSQLKDQIQKMIDEATSPKDFTQGVKIAPWVMPLAQGVQTAQDSHAIETTLRGLMQQHKDTELMKLASNIRQVIAATSPTLQSRSAQSPTPPTVPSSSIQAEPKGRAQFIKTKDQILKMIDEATSPKDFTQAVKIAPWVMPLAQGVQKAQDSHAIESTLLGLMQQHKDSELIQLASNIRQALAATRPTLQNRSAQLNFQAPFKAHERPALNPAELIKAVKNLDEVIGKEKNSGPKRRK